MAEKKFVLEIGRGDLNADWIKHLNGGRAGLIDQMAGVDALIAHMESTGDEDGLKRAQAQKKGLESKLAEIEENNGGQNRKPDDRGSDQAEVSPSPNGRHPSRKPKRPSANRRPV